jgi:predicted Zn-dependent peptidase
MDNIKTNPMLSENLSIQRLSSGFLCYIIPKKGYVEKQAMIATKYGSIDNAFAVNGERRDMPEGIAHFLEHKLFEQPDGSNVFDQFSRFGGECNAFTNFTSTAFYFNCTDRFDENLRLLLSFVQEPYFTDQTVAKEKGIITQEISMYDDDPTWVVYFKLLRALYNVCPVRRDIAGTADSIQAITKDMLYDCYNAFYHPANMALIVAGDVDPDKIIQTAEQDVKTKAAQNIERFYGDEPKTVHEQYTECKRAVALPLFNIGFKDDVYAADPEKKTAETKVLLDIAFGESSKFYAELYGEGYIDDQFDMNYMNSPYFGATVLGGYAKEPQKVADCLLKELARLKKNSIPDDLFERTKKKHIGRFIKGFNALSAIVYGQTEYFIKNTDCIAAFNCYLNLTKDDIIKRLYEHLDEQRMALSVVKP